MRPGSRAKAQRYTRRGARFAEGCKRGPLLPRLHCHTDKSDGLLGPEEVVSACRDAGYDFLCLSDHFEEGYGWRVTDTRRLRDEEFTTILGAELNSAPWERRDCYWATAAGLPPDFGAPPAGDHAQAIRRATDVGAFVVMLHPGLNNPPLAAAGGLPSLEWPPSPTGPTAPTCSTARWRGDAG